MRAAGARLCVVGGGVLGLAVAADAARAGWRVTLLEREPALCRVASGASFAWANAHAKRPASYAALSREGLLRHAEASATGSEPWFTPMSADAWGTRVVEGGVVDVAAFARAHARAVRDHGGVVRAGASVVRVDTAADGARVVLDSGEPVVADTVVLAAGVATPTLLDGLGTVQRFDVLGPIGALARVRRPSGWPGGLVLGDELSVRPDGDDRLLLQSLSLERALLDEALPLDERAAWQRLREITPRHGLQLGDDDLLELRFAHRPLPPHGLPIAGWAAERVYAVVAHSGVTLAPALGRLVVAELGGEPQPELQRCRPPGSVPNHSQKEPTHGKEHTHGH